MEKKSNNRGMTRRDFITTSSLAAGSMAFMPSFASMINAEIGIKLNSPLDTKIRIKVINDGIVHEDAWEGSCRNGDLSRLTYEAEKENLRTGMERLKATISSMNIPKEVEILEPVTMHSWVEKGNPDIMMPDEQLDMLAQDNNKTDLYVLSSPFIGYRIAKRYRKPVCILQPNGWGVDGPAGIRTLGVEGYHAINWDELFELTKAMKARKAFAGTKLLNVTNFPDRVPWGVVSDITDMDAIKGAYGLDYEFMDYRDFFDYMNKLESDKGMVTYADEIAGKLLKNAKTSNMTRENIAKSVMFYLAVMSMMEKQGCNAFTIECFELCSSLNPWNRKFTPCLTHALLKDSGIPSACEGDINALLAMMVQMYLSDKAIYMGNPDVDKVNNQLKLHHSVASLKMFGIDREPTPYEIHSFMQAGYGATLRHDFSKHVDKEITVGRFDPSGKKMMISAGEVIGGSGLEGCGCAQNVEMKIPNGRKFWKTSLNYGHHLAFVYGDYTRQIEDLGEMMGFEVENIV